MKSLGTVIDIGAGTVSFAKIGVKDLPLQRTCRGHLAVSLLDFDMDNMSVFSDLVEGYDEHENPEPTDDAEELARLGLSRPPTPPSVTGSDGLDPDTRHEIADSNAIYFDQYIPEEHQHHNIDWNKHREQFNDGFHCECADTFLQDVEKGHFAVRKPSHRKSKKIIAMDEALTGLDISVNKLITGNMTKVSRKPPFGKSWLKQVFAGKMGLTLLAVLHGMTFGIPRDICINGWDAATACGKRQLHLDLQQEDPYCVVLTQPCGPWGNWSRFNLAKGGSAEATVKQLREDGRPVLSAVNKTVRDRVKSNRHIFLEQPLGRKFWKNLRCLM